MVCKVSTHEDLTANSDESLSPPRTERHPESAVAEAWTFDVQSEGIFLGQVQKFREPGSCFLQRRDQNHLNTWRLNDLLQDLRNHLEWRKYVQDSPPVVPRNRHGAHELRPGVRIWGKLDDASVGECREQVDLCFAPLGKHWSETLHGHRPLSVQCLADSGQRISLDVVDSWQMDGNQFYRTTSAGVTSAT